MSFECRSDGRRVDELRPVKFQRDYTMMADGSVLAVFGDTKVLCTASVIDGTPKWLGGDNTGWVTAEYSMLPGSSFERVSRRAGGRVKEIQRLIGRSLRAVTDLKALGARQVIIDCDVLQADGGTRTASVCGGFLALHDAVSRLVRADELEVLPLLDECAAISVGIVDGVAVLDLPYLEDANADVDFNVVMTGSGGLIEVQGTAEREPFTRAQLDQLLNLAASGIAEIVEMQRRLLADPPEPRPPHQTGTSDIQHTQISAVR
ncbi:MAG: ribonuclease PH [Acidimicrobiaceae bacterium]|nr:ribonuclease PH [Acidimicrobiaceae bacterium]